MSRKEATFPITEAAMVSLFLTFLRSDDSPWCSTGILEEFDYRRGRTDVVVTTSDSIIAFEAKLTNWRRALDQAYRNTCYAVESYVLLPADRARYAAKYIAEFEVRGVGLCCIENGKLEILHMSARKPPVEPWLTARVRQLVAG
jgi:hypothetical protein